jgi:hypothetical protein
MNEEEPHKPSSSLQTLIELESVWLSQAELRQRLLSCLEQFGWVVNQISWQESLKLSIESNLIERWLGENRPYRKAIENSGEVSANALPELRRELLQQRGRRLPQSLRHWRIEGRLA